MAFDFSQFGIFADLNNFGWNFHFFNRRRLKGKQVAKARQKIRRTRKVGEDVEEQISSGEQDVAFELKENIENKFISAINSFNKQKVLMNDEITKHPDKLIKIQKF